MCLLRHISLWCNKKKKQGGPANFQAFVFWQYGCEGGCGRKKWLLSLLTHNLVTILDSSHKMYPFKYIYFCTSGVISAIKKCHYISMNTSECYSESQSIFTYL